MDIGYDLIKLSRLVLFFKPYVIVIKSLLNNQTKCGTNKTRNISKVIKYLKSNF